MQPNRKTAVVIKSLVCSFAFGAVSLTAEQPAVTQSDASCCEGSDDCCAEAESAAAAGVDERGDKAMGFSHRMTGHHFHLLADGGAIEAEANAAGDHASQTGIREHMGMIAGMFSEGNFTLPMFIHAALPPGVETMQRLKGEISYTAENTANGAQVRITTKNPEALSAIHEFLRFQITDHRTGDPLVVK